MFASADRCPAQAGLSRLVASAEDRDPQRRLPWRVGTVLWRKLRGDCTRHEMKGSGHAAGRGVRGESLGRASGGSVRRLVVICHRRAGG